MSKIKILYLPYGIVKGTQYHNLMHLYYPLSRSFSFHFKDGRFYCSLGCSVDSCINLKSTCTCCACRIDYKF